VCELQRAGGTLLTRSSPILILRQVWKARLFEVKPNTRGEAMLHHNDCAEVWAFGVPRSKPDREDTARVSEAFRNDRGSVRGT
jgi:hypothetical protein